MHALLKLGCKACAATGQLYVPVEPCPASGEHLHLEGTPRFQQWLDSHRMPVYLIVRVET